MKRIAFDLRCLPSDGSPGAGIAHAARELFIACVERAPVYGLECVGYVVGQAEVGGKGRVARLRSRSLLLPALTRDRFQALFAPSGSIPLGNSLPAFAWVHDVAIFSHPEWFPQSWVRRQFTTRLFLYGLKSARHIFCVSKDTRRALTTVCDRHSEDISVTGEGVCVSERIAALGERLDRVVVLGTVEPRKNISFLTELWPEVCARLHRSISLVVAGRRGWGTTDEHIGGCIQRVTDLSDRERDQLLATSRLVLVPSLYEGFGRVALEAMAAGTPVIVSRVGAHLEVVGEAGILLEPSDREGWIQNICALLTDSALWGQKQAMGIARAQGFSWQRVADQTLAVIEKNC